MSAAIAHRVLHSIRKPRSFAWHLGVLAIGLMAPTLLFVGILLTRFSAAESSRIESEARVMARTLALTVGQKLNDRVATLQALATSPSLATGDLETFYGQIKALQEQQGQHYGLREPHGDILLSTRVPYGQPIARTDPAVRAADETALERRAPFVSDVYVGPVSGIANVTIAAPVLRHHPPRLVVGASIDAASITGLIESLHRPEGWAIGLIDRSGTIVARLPGLPGLVGRKASATFRSQPQDNGLYYGGSPTGVPSLIAYDTVPGIGWRVAVSVPESEITGLLARTILALLGVGAALGAIGGGFAWAMHRRLAGSVASVGALADSFRHTAPAPSAPPAVSEIARVGEALRIASEELRENEARFRGVFESSLCGFSIFDCNTGETLAVNGFFLAMTGFSRADFDEGRWDWRVFTPAEFLPLDEAAIRQARQRGWWDPYEKKYRRRDGSLFPVRIASAPLPGQPGRVVVSIEDISARRAAERELRDSERRLQLAKQAAGLGVWDWDLDSGAIAWTPEMFGLLGIPADTPPDRLFAAWEAVLLPQDRDEARTVAMRAAETGEPFSMDVRIMKDGAVRWVRSQAVGVLDADGRPLRLTGVNLDVTAQHEREESLQREADSLAAAVEERTRERDRIFELSSDLFAVMGYDGTLKVINPAWSKLLGFSEAEILARPASVAIHPDDHAAVLDLVETLRGGHRVHGFEDRLLTADGGVVWISWTCVPGPGDTFYAVGRDVTKEREREEILRQSQKMEAVGQLTGGIAHDFNNLLGAVVGGFDLIRRKPHDADRVRRLAENGLAAAERGARLTGQLLAFSRAQKLEQRPLMPAELIEGMHDLLKSTLGPQVRIRLALASRSCVRSDAIQLEMAILNLAINARDAMAEGGDLTIGSADRTLAGDPELPDGEYVEISVADTGGGMTPDVQARAFDPFFTTKGVGKGTGLGLSQVYGVARQGGGGVRIESVRGSGTLVRILLPRTNEEPERQTAADSGMAQGAGRAATVLIVDDDGDMRRMLGETLDTLGYRVVQAEDGAQALRLFGSGNPDAVILDFAMPGMNGAEVGRAMRAERPQVPIIFASGYSETAAIEAAVGRPHRLLAKPFRIHELQAALAEALASGGR